MFLFGFVFLMGFSIQGEEKKVSVDFNTFPRSMKCYSDSIFFSKRKTKGRLQWLQVIQSSIENNNSYCFI